MKRLAEEEKNVLDINNGTVTLELLPHKIETVYLEV